MNRLAGFILSFFLLSPALTWAQSPFRDDLPHISWDKTRLYYGQECVVYGTVVAARDIGSRCFLNFHENFREHFTVVVPSERYAKFSERPDLLYRGKHVRVAGKIVEFQGKPEIVLTGPEAIEIIADPTPPANPAATPGAPGQDGAEVPATGAPAVGTHLPPPPQPAADGVVRIATFNLLNLFDDLDDPYVEMEKLPGKSEDEARKLAALLRQIAADLVSLQEVESRPVLQHFVDTYLRDFGYEVVLFEGNSDRGIDVGLLSRLPVRQVTSHRHLDFADGNGQPMRFQRDLLQVSIAPPGHAPFDVFVVHLKSKHGGEEESLPLRMGEARVIRGILDDILADRPDARFVICGDFNDTLESKPLTHLIGGGSMALRAFHEDLPSEKRITYNRNHLSMIDFIFASPAMAAGYVSKSYNVVMGTVETNGSDHNPVYASFRLAPGGATN